MFRAKVSLSFLTVLTHLPVLTILPRQPALPVAAVIDPVGPSKLFPRGPRVPALGPHQGDEVEFVEVNLEELHIFRLEETRRAPSPVTLLSQQPEFLQERERVKSENHGTKGGL